RPGRGDPVLVRWPLGGSPGAAPSLDGMSGSPSPRCLGLQQRGGSPEPGCPRRRAPRLLLVGLELPDGGRRHLVAALRPPRGRLDVARQPDWFAVTFSGAWLATNLYGVATYVADAREMDLPLVTVGGGEPGHDLELPPVRPLPVALGHD